MELILPKFSPYFFLLLAVFGWFLFSLFTRGANTKKTIPGTRVIQLKPELGMYSLLYTAFLGLLSYVSYSDEVPLFWLFLFLFLIEFLGGVSKLAYPDKLMIKQGLAAKTGVFPVALITTDIQSVKFNSLSQKLTITSTNGLIALYSHQFKKDFSYDEFLTWLAQETRGENIEVSDNLIEKFKIDQIGGKNI